MLGGGVVREPVTGMEFPVQQRFWAGAGPLTSLGAGARVKKVGFLSIKVYAVTMYVEAEACAQADRQEQQPGSEAASLDVLQNGPFLKALQMHLVRNVTGKQFVDALDESLRPLMSGEEAPLDGFCAFFHGRQLESGTEVTLLRHPEGSVDVVLRPPGDQTPYASALPGLSCASARLAHALWLLYLSPKPPSPDARKAWLAGVPALAPRQAGA